ncbi:outer membrane beta-barrel protein [Rufibacter sp. LB8]|uniref:outer membrane beta-barrel protein n=1 Tax=Rufibacter sp. LB8 TaxID=2777781 RepID=UPI00178C4EDA|nr:outer membrane beta-barrel protein [Rufibacter sp. LB8]
MKKLLFTLVLFSCFLVSAQAQTEKGTKLIGGTGTLHFDTEGAQDDVFFMATPRLGYFAGNNFAIGASLPFLYNTSTYGSVTSIGLAPFVRGYFGASATKFFLEGRAGVTRENYETEGGFMYSDAETSRTVQFFGVGAGLAQFINEHVGLEILLSYDKSDEASFRFETNKLNGLNLNIGFQIHLPRKK